MPTRLYFEDIVPDLANPPAIFVPDAAWSVVSSTRRWLTNTRLSSSMTTLSSPSETSASVINVLGIQFISLGTLAAQSISGTVKGQMRVSESNADADFSAQLVIRVMTPSGDVRGTLLAAHSGALASEFATSLTNRKFPRADFSPATLTPVSAQTGDRLAIEVGCRTHNTHTTARSASFRVGTSASADLPEDETSTTDSRPWIELSADLVWENSRLISQVALEASSSEPHPQRLISQVALESSYALDDAYWDLGLG